MNSNKRMHGGMNRRSALSLGPIAIALAALIGPSGPDSIVTSVWADSIPSVQVGAVQEGQITSVGLTFVEIERTSYRLDPKVVIRHENGMTLDVRQLEPGMGVQFKLKEGALSHIVVLKPR